MTAAVFPTFGDLLASETHVPYGIFFVPIFLGFVVFMLFWRSKRKKEILARWASAEAVHILECEERSVARGPFWWRTAKGQVVFRILVEYPDGTTASGWIKCGAWLVGLMSDETEVRWDTQKPQAPGFPVIIQPKQESKHASGE